MDIEERIFAQIRKVRIQYMSKDAQMLLIRNISHIIHYEKVKNENKFTELLTATVSHEMLTPLNSITTLSVFVE